MSPQRQRPRFGDLRARMADAGFRPTRQRGQNFLLEEPILERIVDAAEPIADRVVLEIGTGLGFLTAHLARRARHVVTVEVDARLAEIARDEAAQWTAGRERVTWLTADVLADDGRTRISPTVTAAVTAAMTSAGVAQWAVVSNLPYRLAGPILAELVALPAPPSCLVLLCQKEMVDRVLAPADTSEYGALSATVQLGYAGTLVRAVPASAFRPRPRVASAVLRLDRRTPPPALDWRAFAAFARSLFAARRKTLRNALRRLDPSLALADADRLLAGCGLSPMARPETCAPAVIAGLFRAWQAAARQPSSRLDRGPHDT